MGRVPVPLQFLLERLGRIRMSVSFSAGSESQIDMNIKAYEELHFVFHMLKMS